MTPQDHLDKAEELLHHAEDVRNYVRPGDRSLVSAVLALTHAVIAGVTAIDAQLHHIDETLQGRP